MFKKNNTTEITENYDYIHGVTKNIRLNSICKPPKNSIAEMIFNNDIKKLEKLLKENKVDPNSRDGEGLTSSWTPLYWSVKLGKLEFARLLLTHDASINVVVNDIEECCGTVLDLATLRGDQVMENLLREFAEKEDVNLGQSFKALRTKLRGKSPAFNFKYYRKKSVNE
jgi:ankyrin repeat protein